MRWLAAVGLAWLLLGCAHGRPAPALDLPALDGRRVRLEDYRGRVVLVNFWATWCAPCHIEAPWLVALHGRGLALIGVAMDDPDDETAARVTRFVAEHHLDYPVVLGNESVARAWGGLGLLPQSYLVGRDGTILRVLVGLTSEADLDEAMAAQR